MAVDNYKTVEKIEIDEFIELALNGEFVMRCAPIEHYSIEELKSLSEKARLNNLLMIVKEESSNFYQGILIHLILKKDVKNYVRYL